MHNLYSIYIQLSNAVTDYKNMYTNTNILLGPQRKEHPLCTPSGAGWHSTVAPSQWQ